MSYICMIANKNGVAVSGDSRLTLEPHFLRLHFDRLQKVYSDASQGMVWACCGLTIYLGINYFSITKRILRQSHRSLASRLNEISSILSKATKLQNFVTRRNAMFTLLLACEEKDGFQIYRMDVYNGKTTMKKCQSPVLLQGGWNPSLYQNAPSPAEFAEESLEQLMDRAKKRCMWAMKRDKHLYEENHKHTQTVGGNVRLAYLSKAEKGSK
jgi:hypothetical protein